jgi:hypothetical protein
VKDTTTYQEDRAYQDIENKDMYNHETKAYRCDELDKILDINHSTETGKMHAWVKWISGNESMLDTELIHRNDPIRLAKFILEHPVERTRSGYWNEWSQKLISTTSKVIRRVNAIYKNWSCNQMQCYVRMENKSWKWRETQFGIQVPTDVEDATNLDRENGNNKLQESIDKEMSGIKDRGTFLFLPPGSLPPDGYQEGPLKLIFNVKPDLWHKSRLALGG